MIHIKNRFVRALVLSITVYSLFFAGLFPLTTGAQSYTVSAWWPTSGAHLQDTQPFKAVVQGLDVSQYDMFWQVDDGQWNSMNNSYTNYQHKEASVNLSTWTWHGSGPYVVNFIARKNGVVIAQQSETIYVDNVLPVQGTEVLATTLSVATNATPVTAVPQSAFFATPLISMASVASPPVANNTSVNLYVDPISGAATQEAVWKTSNPAGAAAMQILASQPTAVWFGDWNTNVANDVRTLVAKSAAQNAVPVMIVYNIPQRDCGGFSSGGSNNPAGYTNWINSFAQGLGSAQAIVVLEPDALAQIHCLSGVDQATRLQLLSAAVSTLKQNAHVKVYLDAGHSNWIDATTMASELTKANVAQADGFALNVSNFMSTAGEVAYGQQISPLISGKHFIVDTSRNGNGSNGQWCNPQGAAIGQKPTLQTNNALADGFLWLKTPGESDGMCNGGPSAGVWWPSYALSLVQNAH